MLFRSADLAATARLFGLPQIEVVQPLLVICLGLEAFNAIREACAQVRVKSLEQAIEGPFRHSGTKIWCQAHTGARGQRSRGAVKVGTDWSRMAKWFKKQ